MKQTVNDQTKLYLYDLHNAAREHGFKTDDTWEFSLASENEKNSLQRNYYPTIASKMFPEVLLEVLHAIKSALKQPFGQDDEGVNKRSIAERELVYIVAYNAKRPRT